MTKFELGDHCLGLRGSSRERLDHHGTHDTEFKGYTHHATPADPQYGIKSDKTDHVAIHKGAVLKKSHA